MPYITQEERDKLNNRICDLAGDVANEGQLNYVITQLCHQVIRRWGVRYIFLNKVIGVLECAKLELHRTVAAPYEDIKQKDNGPISELDGG